MPFYLEPSNEFPQKKENLVFPVSGLVFSHISDFFLLLTSATPVFKTPLPTQGFVLTVPFALNSFTPLTEPDCSFHVTCWSFHLIIKKKMPPHHCLLTCFIFLTALNTMKHYFLLYKSYYFVCYLPRV